MRSLRRWLGLKAAGVGVALATLSGCQTWVPEAGMTLPTGHYLDGHYPQYFPQTAPYPLPRETANLQAASAGPTPPAPVGLIPGGQ
ncbi:MAG TPA: hypothetical protein VEL76_24995 [Gemmataceae bacterium]|nr:hypothetical protein [Gemmataceae bacterium]